VANSYSAPDFDIDTDVDEAGLVTLKGGALASTDNIYVYNSARVTLDTASSIDLNKIYLGDNSAGTAATKIGYCTITKAGYTITLHQLTNYKGLEGEGSSSYTITGTSGSPVTIKSNTANVCGDYDLRSQTCDYDYVTFENFICVACNNTTRKYNGVIAKGSTSTYSWIFYAMPDVTQFTDNGVEDLGSATRRIYVVNAESVADMNALLENFKVVRSAASAGGMMWYIPEPTGTYYTQLKRRSYSWDGTDILDRIDKISQLTFTLLTG